MRTRVGIATLAVLALAAMAWLYAASTPEFRIWMGDRAFRRGDYPDAILWYSRAMRILKQPESRFLQQTTLAKLYRSYEGFCQWDFDGRNIQAWTGVEVPAAPQERDGILRLESSGTSSLEVVRLRLAPHVAYRFRIRQRCQAGSLGRLSWAPAGSIYTSRTDSTFPVTCDGQWHEYSVDIEPLTTELGSLRLIPTDQGSAVEIDWIRVLPVGK